MGPRGRHRDESRVRTEHGFRTVRDVPAGGGAPDRGL